MKKKKPTVQTGLDILGQGLGHWRSAKAALFANESSVDRNLRYSWDLFYELDFPLKRIFVPEHGLFGTKQDQQAVADRQYRHWEIRSLYGKSIDSLVPQSKWFSDIDTLFIDIQDIGCRYYTYAQTMLYIMRQLSGTSVKCVIFDRPNPINGIDIGGPMLAKTHRSFVGELPVCVRHGLTIGELAHVAKIYEHLDTPLTVIPMKGWRRDMFFRDTGLPWVPPSPNMPTWETALLYPGLCLLEGTNLSEGRGTTTPFMVFGAPFINADDFAAELNARKLPGVTFRPTEYIPTFHKYHGKLVKGAFVHITDASLVPSFDVGLCIVECAHRMYPKKFQFRRGEYEFNKRRYVFDLLAGNDKLRTGIEAGRPIHELLRIYEPEIEEFEKQSQRFLFYGR